MLQVTNLIIKRENKILLVKRADNDVEGGKWSIPGGKIDDGETKEVALKREIKEEMNCEIIEFKFFKKYNWNFDMPIETNYFVGDISGDIKLQEEELSEYKWFDLNEKIIELSLAFNQSDVLKDFLASL